MTDDRVPGELAPDADIEALRREIEEIKRRVFTLGTPVRKVSGGPSAFMVMPFGPEDLQIVYEDFIKPAIEDRCGLDCIRGDDMFGSNAIMEDVVKSIRAARMMVADLTGQNANVFYEVGIAHAIDIPVLLITQSLDDVPFDLRHRRMLVYEYSPRGCKRLESQLEEHVKQMLVQ